MSRFAKKVGQKAIRFQFDVTVDFVEIHIPIEATVMVIWKRGAKRIETKEKVSISPDQPKGAFTETMSMLATLSKDPAKGKFIEKNTTFTVKIITETKMKSVGMIKINLAKFADKEKGSEVFPLKKCPDRNATIGLTIKSSIIQEGVSDGDTLSQMTDLRSLDSAPDSQYDFGDLNKSNEEEDARGYDSKKSPLEMLQRDKERQKKGLPPMFSGPGSSNFGLKKIAADQFSLKSKGNSNSSIPTGPIKPGKIASKDNLYESPDKMEDWDITTDEEGNLIKSPAGSITPQQMPDTSHEIATDYSGDSDIKKVKLVKKTSIKKKKKSKDKEELKIAEPASTFDYKSKEIEEAKTIKSGLYEPKLVKEQSKEVSEEIKDLRNKIRKLEEEKRKVKEELIQVKQDWSEQISRAVTASSSDDQQVELLKLNLSDLEVKKDRLELQLTKKDNEMEKIKRKLEDKDIDIKNLKDKNEEFKNKIKEGEQKVLNLEIEMKKFRERIEGYEQDNSSLRKEITTLTTSFGRAKDENSELSDMITKLRTQLENRRSSLKDSSQLDEDEFEEYKNATETLISNYKSQIEELERKNTDLAAKYEQIHSDFKDNKEQEYLAKIKDLTHKIDLIESLDSSQKATIKELESRIETLMEEKLGREREHQDSKGELHGKHRALETQFKQVNDKLKDREEYVKTLESKITRIEEEKIYFISNEEQKREEIMYEFKSELKELKEKCHELENKNDELLIEKDTLQQKLKREQNSNLDSDDILEGNQRMLSQIKLLQNQLLDKDKKIIDLQEGLESSP